MNWIGRMILRLGGIDTTAFANESKAAGGAVVGAPSYAEDGKAIKVDWSGEKAIAEGLKASTWVYGACRRIASSLASVPLRLEYSTDGEIWAAKPNEELQALLNRPNPFMARQDILERWAYHLNLTGNAIWQLTLAGGKPRELWPILPDHIKPVPGGPNYLRGYEYKPNSKTKAIMLPVEEIAHWQFVDPANTFWGLSPLQAAALAVDQDAAAARWNRAVLANDGKPPNAVFLSENLTIQEQEHATKLIRDQVSGANARQVLVLGGASKVQPLSLSAADLDYLNGRKFSREEIGTVFGVPPVLLSFGEAATFANLDAAKLMLWEDTLVPLLDDLCSGLEVSLFPYWGYTSANWRIRADLSNVRALQSNLKTQAETGKIKAETAAILINAGWTQNQVDERLDLGFGNVEGGDLRKTDIETKPPGEDLGDEGATGTKRQRLNAYESKAAKGAVERREAWVRKLTGKVAELLRSQGDSAAAAYVEGSLDSFHETSLDDWYNMLEAMHETLLEAEGKVAFAELLRQVFGNRATGAFDVLADNVTGWIKERTGESVKGITSTTRDVLAALVGNEVEAGASTADIAKAIKERFEQMSENRAALIARTEVNTAFGAAHQIGAEQLADQFEVDLYKTWRAVGDARTREDHDFMDGETVPINESFSNGLDYPNEPNCRCVVTYGPK